MIERTTIVSFETGSTSSPDWMNYLDNLIETRSDCFVTDVVKDPGGRVVGKHYSFPQKFIILTAR